MNKLWQTVFDLLRLRAGPQDLPDRRKLTLFVVGIYITQAVMTSTAIRPEDEPARTLMAIAIQFGAVALILAWRKTPERLSQTLLALAATGTVISLIAFMFLVQADPQVNQPLLFLVWFAIFGWSLAVDANILRHALNVGMPIAMLITVMLLAVTYMAVELTLQTGSTGS